MSTRDDFEQLHQAWTDLKQTFVRVAKEDREMHVWLAVLWLTILGAELILWFL